MRRSPRSTLLGYLRTVITPSMILSARPDGLNIHPWFDPKRTVTIWVDASVSPVLLADSAISKEESRRGFHMVMILGTFAMPPR
ncbi:unnamed protein product [Dibothriocephalus latus]|uniref:Uncharacterized protein n=1 Tax=Dibothriocephalus latus TaxID=60516 RepID=A0A3P7RY38_DIBLA|nr:unnamed protein product [Dibothriocephalus latus]